jgi:hypothetical protein
VATPESIEAAIRPLLSTTTSGSIKRRYTVTCSTPEGIEAAIRRLLWVPEILGDEFRKL